MDVNSCHFFTTPHQIVNPGVFNQLQSIIDNFEQNGSNWTLESIICAEWTIVQNDRVTYHQGLGGRGPGSKSEDLQKLIHTKRIVNVDNGNDNKCFLWAILSVLHYNDVVNKHYSKCVNQYS